MDAENQFKGRWRKHPQGKSDGFVWAAKFGLQLDLNQEWEFG